MQRTQLVQCVGVLAGLAILSTVGIASAYNYATTIQGPAVVQGLLQLNYTNPEDLPSSRSGFYKTGTVTLQVEPDTGDLVAITGPSTKATPYGELFVLNHAQTFTYSAYRATDNGVYFSPLQYTATNPTGGFTTNEGYARIPLKSGALVKHIICQVAENTKDAPTRIWLHFNGGPVSTAAVAQAYPEAGSYAGPLMLEIGAGKLGKFDRGQINVNVNYVDQLTWKLDTSESRKGHISFYCQASL